VLHGRDFQHWSTRGEVERIAIFHLLPGFSDLRQHLRD
jgi:hypothetical protein